MAAMATACIAGGAAFFKFGGQAMPRGETHRVEQLVDRFDSGSKTERKQAFDELSHLAKVEKLGEAWYRLAWLYDPKYHKPDRVPEVQPSKHRALSYYREAQKKGFAKAAPEIERLKSEL